MRTLLVGFLWCIQANMNIEAKPLHGSGFILNESTGLAYRIVYQSQNWPVARDKCEHLGGKLAVPETEEDFQFIQQLVRAMTYPAVLNTDYNLLVWLGINNLDNFKIWKTINGKHLEDTNFNIWTGDNGVGYSDAVEEPHCAGMDAKNYGFRDWWCHRRQPYVCQLDTNQ